MFTPQGYRDKLLYASIHTLIYKDQYNHRHSHTVSMKHLSSNNIAQGKKTGWAREICKTGFQIESLQKKLLPGDVGKWRERDSER